LAGFLKAMQARRLPSRTNRRGGLLALAGMAMAGTAVLARHHTKRAELNHPPKGQFVTADGTRLHYVERGAGRPVVFLHGNGAMVDDLIISGVIDKTAQHYRAVAFDRPGFGHSERPRGRQWSAAAQAALFPEAFDLLDIERPIVVGHSWGTLVALALALDHPSQVSGLVLISGYYYPTPRADVTLFAPPAIPVVGDVISHTVAPLIGEIIAPRVIERMFAPEGVPPRFAATFPVSLTLRPSQIQAFAGDSSHMIAAAEELSPHYPSLLTPTVILAGDADEIVNHQQAQRLHADVAESRLEVLPGRSHMVHHSSPERVVAAIDSIAAELPQWER
jgi:pimeloyl-ACP methyl ester carboxylesterase